jgi:hypothetical protein
VGSKRKEKVGEESGKVGVEAEGSKRKTRGNKGGGKGKGEGGEGEGTSKLDELLPDGARFFEREQFLCHSKPSLMSPTSPSSLRSGLSLWSR